MVEDHEILLCVMQKGEGEKRDQTKPLSVAVKLLQFLSRAVFIAYFISSLTSSYLGERRCE